MIAITNGSLTSTEDVAGTRIFRLAVGLALALAFSQAVNWPASFITPILVATLLALPLPAPSIKFALGFILVITGSLLLGLLLLPALHNQPAAGVLLIALGIFACFYYAESGGSAALITFLLLGVTIIPAVGSESVDGALIITGGLIVGAIIAFLFIWLAYALFPERLATMPPAKPKAAVRATSEVVRGALRSSSIVLPVMLWFLFASETSAYAAVLIKVATMGQQTSLEGTRAAGRDLMLSTLIGGIAALIIWNVLQIWPSLLIYSLLFLLCGLMLGPRIFADKGLAPLGPVWSYGLVTMIILIVPAAADTVTGDAAGAKFFDRIAMFVIATFYAVAAVYIFDQLWPAKKAGNNELRIRGRR